MNFLKFTSSLIIFAFFVSCARQPVQAPAPRERDATQNGGEHEDDDLLKVKEKEEEKVVIDTPKPTAEPADEPFIWDGKSHKVQGSVSWKIDTI